MLRIDPLNPALTPASPDPVSANGQYRIPTTNPFQGAGQVPEIYAYGFRNPYRFAFDTLNGDLIMADVGQNTIEEIDRIVLGGNYGWAIKEGTSCSIARRRRTAGQRRDRRGEQPGRPAGLIDPISGPMGTLEYDHGDGISITGGFVYRGTAIPELFGKYVFGDLALRNQAGVGRIDGRLFYADLETGPINEFLLPQFANDQLPNGDRAWLRPGRPRRAVRAGDQHAGQRHGRDCLQVRGGAGAGDGDAARGGSAAVGCSSADESNRRRAVKQRKQPRRTAAEAAQIIDHYSIGRQNLITTLPLPSPSPWR